MLSLLPHVPVTFIFYDVVEVIMLNIDLFISFTFSMFKIMINLAYLFINSSYVIIIIEFFSLVSFINVKLQQH